MKTATDLERFQEATSELPRWARIDQIVEACEGAGYFDEEFIRASEANSKKSHIRRMIKQVKDDGGFPVWASVETQDEEGNRVRVYKQEFLFDVADYRQVVQYHSGKAEHHREMAQSYANRCNERYKTQLTIDF